MLVLDYWIKIRWYKSKN